MSRVVFGQSMLMTDGNSTIADTAAPSRGTATEFEDAWQREEFFRRRTAYPHDEIPAGAFAKAARYARTMPLYTPHGNSTQMVTAWHSVGPDNVGGRITAIAVNPRNPNTIYIGSADGGVWKTEDEGMSWKSVGDELPTQSMGALAIDHSDTNIVYAGTGEGNAGLNTFNGMGLLKTTNNGVTWFNVGDTTFPSSARVSAIAIDPTTSSIVYAAVPMIDNGKTGGLYKSLNAGQTWSLVLKGYVQEILVNPAQPLHLLTTITGIGDTSRLGFIKHSTDGGGTWTTDSIPGVAPVTVGHTAIAQCIGQPNIKYAGISEAGGSRPRLAGLFKSSDDGVTWSKLVVPIDYIVAQGWYDNILLVHPTDPNKIIAGGVRIIQTIDGGSSWTYVPMSYYNAGVVHPDQHAIAFNTLNPDTVYLGNDGGFFRGVDWGGTWTKRSTGLSITQFIGGALYPGSDALQFGGTQDNGTLQSLSSNAMVQTLGGDGGYTAVNGQNPNTIYSEQWGVSVYRSDDLGGSWKRVINGLPSNQKLWAFYVPYAISPGDGNTLYYPWINVYKTTNRGDSWTIPTGASCVLPAPGGSCYYITSITVSSLNDSIVLAGGANEVAISRNKGNTWKLLGTGLPLAYMTSLKHTGTSTAYCTFDGYGTGHVYKLEKDSSQWKNISGNLPDAPVNDVFASGDTVVVGTQNGTFISIEGGTSWSRFGAGMPAVTVMQLLFNAATGTLRAMTHGRGMFDIALIQTPQALPVFRSSPDTSILFPQQDFLYAPVVLANPSAHFTITSTDGLATIDSNVGVVRWKAGASAESITIAARNAVGTAAQMFSLNVASATPATDWRVVSTVETGRRTAQLAAVAPTTLWMTQDSAVVGRSIDGGATWTRHTLPDSLGFASGLAGIDNLTAVVGTWQGNLFRTSNGGDTWTMTGSYPNARWENVSFSDAQFGMAVSTGEKDTALVVVSSDGGLNWTAQPSHVISLRPGLNTLTVYNHNCAAFASSNREASPPVNGSIIRTTDGGKSWRIVNTGMVEIGGISYLDSTLIFAIDRFGGAVQKSTNGGNSWGTLNTPASGSDLVAVKAIPGTKSVWIVSSSKAWYSSDKGVKWLATSLVPMGPAIAAAFIDSSRGWVAGMNNVIQQHDLNPTVFVQEQAGPATFALEAYPNPFAQTTQLKFPVEGVEGARTRLVIVDALGRVVKDLTEEIRDNEGGGVSARFNAEELPAGAYSALLQVAEKMYRTSLVVVK